MHIFQPSVVVVVPFVKIKNCIYLVFVIFFFSVLLRRLWVHLEDVCGGATRKNATTKIWNKNLKILVFESEIMKGLFYVNGKIDIHKYINQCINVLLLLLFLHLFLLLLLCRWMCCNGMRPHEAAVCVGGVKRFTCLMWHKSWQQQQQQKQQLQTNNKTATNNNALTATKYNKKFKRNIKTINRFNTLTPLTKIYTTRRVLSNGNGIDQLSQRARFLLP